MLIVLGVFYSAHAMILARTCHCIAMALGTASQSLHCHAVAMVLPCRCHAFAMVLQCLRCVRLSECSAAMALQRCRISFVPFVLFDRRGSLCECDITQEYGEVS